MVTHRNECHSVLTEMRMLRNEGKKEVAIAMEALTAKNDNDAIIHPIGLHCAHGVWNGIPRKAAYDGSKVHIETYYISHSFK